MMKHITLFTALAVSFGATAQITDGSFEAGIGAGTWTEASVNFGTPLCNAAACGTGGGAAVPRTGEVFAWFGGLGDASEMASVDQSAFIPSGTTANLLVYVKIPASGDGTANNYLKAFVDGNEVGAVTAVDSATYADYTLWSVQIDSYADGSNHNIKLEGKENGTAVFNILADDIALEVDGSVVAGLFENEALSGVQVYPNPANESITLSFTAMSGMAEITIQDVTGKVVARNALSEVNRRTVEFDASALSNGLYMVSIQQQGKRFTERVLVQH
ncbi:MAG: T9SS type A sorting domain-containing protein [Flavobacteriales bacterium]|nr:T9SS type A sorting domain-containing protein [Flavobacteriales bacterium]